MPKFTDNADREWTVEVHLGTVKRIRSELGINIVDSFDLRSKERKDFLSNLSSDPVLLFDVLYVICKPQCDALELTGEQFAEALFGDTIEHATTALLEALCDFFPNPRRDIMRALLKAMQAKMTAQIPPEGELQETIERIAEAAVSRSGRDAWNLPESSELTSTG